MSWPAPDQHRVSADQLHRKILPLNPDHRLQGECRGPLVEGHIEFQRIGTDLSVHCLAGRELVDTRSSSEINAGLSINIFLKGRVSFALGLESFRVSAEHSPLGLTLAVSEPQPFTRFLCKGQEVVKVNVSVSKAWLASRLDETCIASLMHTSVTTWTPSRAHIELAQRLMALSHSSRASLLSYELCALELVSLITEQASVGQHSSNPLAPNECGDSLCRQLEPFVEGECDLQTLASRLGMSVSTLQRRFKAAQGITVMEYLRRQRLEKARRALLLAGASVQQAAYLAGYEHPGNFVNAFKRLFNVTPAALVRAHRKTSVGC